MSNRLSIIALRNERDVVQARQRAREIAALLGIAQPDVSHLMNGHYSRFTTDKLLDFLKRLERKVTVQISPHLPGEPYQEVAFTR